MMKSEDFWMWLWLEKPRKSEMKVRSMEEGRNDEKVSYVVVNVKMKLNALTIYDKEILV